MRELTAILVAPALMGLFHWLVQRGSRKAGRAIGRAIGSHQEQKNLHSLPTLGGEVHVIGTAENGQRALELAPVLSPDVIVLDVCMPVLNGIEAAEHLRESGSASKVVFLTAHETRTLLTLHFPQERSAAFLKCSAGTDLITASTKLSKVNALFLPLFV